MEIKNTTSFTIMEKNSTLGINVRKIFYAENYKMLVKEIKRIKK